MQDGNDTGDINAFTAPEGVPVLSPIEELRPDLFDIHDEGALFSKLNPIFREIAIDTANEDPSLFELSEDDLFELLLEQREPPSPHANILRPRLWREYEHALANGIQVIDDKLLFVGLGPRQALINRIFRRRRQLAWVCCSPMDYNNKMRELIEYGTSRMRRLLDLDESEEIYNKKGDKVGKKPNISLMKLKFDVVKYYDDKMNGQAAQKHFHAHATLPMPEAKPALSYKSSDQELLERVAEKRAEMVQALHLPPPEVSHGDSEIVRKIKEEKKREIDAFEYVINQHRLKDE